MEIQESPRESNNDESPKTAKQKEEDAMEAERLDNAPGLDKNDNIESRRFPLNMDERQKDLEMRNISFSRRQSTKAVLASGMMKAFIVSGKLTCFSR